MKSIKQHVMDRLGNRKARKLLIQLGLREIVIRRDFYLNFGYRLPAGNPLTFNEKVNWVKLYRKDERMVTLTDKALVREWVAGRIDEKYLIPLLGLYDSVEEFYNALPDLAGSFVVKLTNGGGGNEVLLCEDKAHVDWDRAETDMKKWFSADYYHRNGEWQYRNLKPRLLCEKMIALEAVDYKIFCFSGEPRLIQVDFKRFSGHKQQFFDNEWNLLPIYYISSPGTEICEKPENFSEMLQVAAKLSEGFDYVRVDLYNVNNTIYFGEMTFTPNNGTSKFKPEEWDEKIGEMWTLNTNRRG